MPVEEFKDVISLAVINPIQVSERAWNDILLHPASQAVPQSVKQ